MSTPELITHELVTDIKRLHMLSVSDMPQVYAEKEDGSLLVWGQNHDYNMNGM